MATTYKILGQACPSAATATTLYTVPASTSAIGSSLTITNQNASNSVFRIAAVKSGGSATPAQGANVFLSYDTVVPANDSITLSIGITLATGDFVVVQANTTNVSFNLFGTEIS